MEIDLDQDRTVRKSASSMLMLEIRHESKIFAQHLATDARSNHGSRPQHEQHLRKGIMIRSRNTLWKQQIYVHVVLFLAVATQINAFTPLFRSEALIQVRQIRQSISRVDSTKSPISDEIVVAVQPMKATSEERRKSAQEALDQAQRDTKESRIWDILQKQRRQQEATESYRQLPVRPKGRPDSVPGAMNMSTMMKLREIPHEQQRRSSATPFQKTGTASAHDSPQPVKKRRGRPRKYPQDAVPAASPAAITTATNAVAAAATVSAPSPNILPTTSPSLSSSSLLNNKGDAEATRLKTLPKSLQKSTTNESQGKGRRRVVKMLPKSKSNDKRQPESGLTTGMVTQSDASTGAQDPPALQRYYRTELLTAEEEYSLGRKVQFMMKCEEVYEGLSIQQNSHPSIAQWAAACGFTETDSIISKQDYVETPYVTQIRPSNNDNSGMSPGGLNDIISSNFFVGNGVAGANGPGRGRGRVKKPPPVKLKNFYDDSAVQFPSVIEEGDSDDKTDLWQQRLKSGKKVIINTGSPDDFVELMLTAKEGKQRMVQCNMRLVVSIAKRYKHVGVNIADLVQEGSIGLTRAAEKFDPGKGFKFSTYASWWIQQAVFRSIAYHSRTIRLPVHVHNLLNRVRRTRIQLQQELGRTPADEEIALQLGMTTEKYIKMLRLTRRAISLEKPKYQNNPKDIGQESEMLLGDTIDATTVIPDENTPEQSVDQAFFQDDLKEMLRILSEDERRVICARYGLEDGLTRTATAVAAQMRQSKSWVRSQECRALRKLRRPWYEKRLWEHQNSLTG